MRICVFATSVSFFIYFYFSYPLFLLPSLSHTHTVYTCIILTHSLYNILQYAVEVLDLVKRTLPVISATTHSIQSEEPVTVYTDTKHLHYANIETDHPYKPSAVTHYRVSVIFSLSGAVYTERG